MKTSILLILIVFAGIATQAQFYYTTGVENIISYGNVTGLATYLSDDATVELTEKPRFTMFFNMEENIHADFDKNFGYYSGISFRNVGFVLRDHDVKYVFRSLNVGVPLALKIGNMDKHQYLIFGAEAEFSIHLKEKTVHDGARRKTGEYFSDKINSFMPSFFFGICKEDFFMKVKFYMDNFIHITYRVDNTMPFLNVSSRIFYFSFGHNFKN